MSQDTIRIRTLFVRQAPARHRVQPHRHDVTQWYHCLHGGMTVAIDGRTFDLHGGDSVVVPPGAERSCRCGATPRYIVAIFRECRLDLRPLYLRLLHMPERLRDEAEVLARELTALGDPDSQFLAQALLVRLLIGLRRANDTGRRRYHEARDEQALSQLVGEVEMVMQRNLHRRLTRDDLGRAVSFSGVHLARLFRQATGTTLYRRLTELRMRQAKALLTSSTMSISQIAAETGFGSKSHFTKAFRAATGLAPSDYRERMDGSFPGE